MSSSYVTIPDDLFTWLTRALDVRAELLLLAGVVLAILEAAGATPDPEATR